MSDETIPTPQTAGPAIVPAPPAGFAAPPTVVDGAGFPVEPNAGDPGPTVGQDPAVVNQLAPGSVVASVTRNKFGEIVDAGATLVGDRAELIAHHVRQLLSVVDADVDEITAHAEKEVDAMLHGELPPPLPDHLRPAATETTSTDAGGEDTSATTAGETTSVPAGDDESRLA